MALQEVHTSDTETASHTNDRLKLSSVLNNKSEKASQLNQIKSRIETCLTNSNITEKTKSDYIFIFKLLGLDENKAEQLWIKVSSLLLQNSELSAIENQIYQNFQNTNIDNKNLLDIWSVRMSIRAQLIYRYISPFIAGTAGKVLDYGAGDGRIAQLLKDILNLNIQGVDQCDYRVQNIGVPFHILDGKRANFSDNEFETALMTNVAHHDENNEAVLSELSRIVQGKLIVMETVPEGETEKEIEQDKERMFMSDYLFNRLFSRADIPIPGLYKTPAEWKACFKKHGWECTHEDDLLSFATVMRDAHHLFVFER